MKDWCGDKYVENDAKIADPWESSVPRDDVGNCQKGFGGMTFHDEISQIRSAILHLVDSNGEILISMRNLRLTVEASIAKKTGDFQSKTQSQAARMTNTRGHSRIDPTATSGSNKNSWQSNDCVKGIGANRKKRQTTSHRFSTVNWHATKDTDCRNSQQTKSVRTVATVSGNQLPLLLKGSETRELMRKEAKRMSWLRYFIRTIRNSDVEAMLDVAIGFVICMNALFIGISADHDDGSSIWFVVDSLFSLVFLLELGMKLRWRGFTQFYTGPGRSMNYFDTLVVGFDTIQFVVFAIILGGGSALEVSILRLIRLVKVVRFIKLLKNEVFKDLMSMIQGLIGGMSTLCWSLVLFTFFVYVLSLIFRELFGRSVEHRENVTDYFNTVPRSMFTTFRCSFGDCSSATGVPIFEHVNVAFGAWAILLYSIFVFIGTIGLFNVISAIFVQSTLLAANKMEMQKQMNRLSDEELWSDSVSILMRHIVGTMELEVSLANLSAYVEEVQDLEIPKDVISEMANHQVCASALQALDISTADVGQLADMLDPDCGGTVASSEFVEGLKCLRGEPRRSDIISVNFLIREVQGRLALIQNCLNID